MVADRHWLAAYHNKHCWRAFRGYQHRWPWTTLKPKNMGFKYFFCYFRLRRTLRLPAYEIKLMLSRVSWALAHISCNIQYSCIVGDSVLVTPSKIANVKLEGYSIRMLLASCHLYGILLLFQRCALNLHALFSFTYLLIKFVTKP